MKKTTRLPVLRALASLVHRRFVRRNNFNYNTRTLQRLEERVARLRQFAPWRNFEIYMRTLQVLEARVAALRRLRREDPRLFATSSFFGPLSPVEGRW